MEMVFTFYTDAALVFKGGQTAITGQLLSVAEVVNALVRQ